MNIVAFFISAFAVWRLTHLISKEDGPFDVMFNIRKMASNSIWGKMMDCFYCCSFWAALPFALWISLGWISVVVNWLALSGAACLLEMAGNRSNSRKREVAEYFED